jgi:prolyl-tRNA synthetase
MGCYGIGVSRVAAAAVEQHADSAGIRWPVPIAPFEVVVAPLATKDAAGLAAADQLYEACRGAGIDVLLDDRPLSAGAKLRDLELLGFPYVVVVGRNLAERGTLEVRDRFAETTAELPVADVLGWLLEQVQRARTGLGGMRTPAV